jgi:predicted DNA repair protein MutK
MASVRHLISNFKILKIISNFLKFQMFMFRLLRWLLSTILAQVFTVVDGQVRPKLVVVRCMKDENNCST